MLSNITYIKDNTLSLKDNRLVSAIISQDVAQVKKLYQNNNANIIYNYTYDGNLLKLPLIFIAIGSNNDEILDIILSNPKLDKDITTNLILYDRSGNTLSTNITPLVYAVYTNKIPLIKKLIEHGADVNKKLIGNRTAIFYVNSKDALELLQNNGADINPLSTQDNTPLMHAVIRNNVIAAFEFIAKGIDPNQINNSNATQLTVAIDNKNISMIKMLLANGADPNFFSPNSYSPLMAAITNSDLQTFHLLLNMGADANIQNKLGKTCIYYIQSLDDQWTIWSSMIDALSDNININHQDINGDTVLHINPERYLLYKDLHPGLNIKNNDGNTPLNNLIKKSNNIDLVKLYLKDGADAKIMNHEGKTPLDIAKKYNKTKLIAILSNE